MRFNIERKSNIFSLNYFVFFHIFSLTPSTKFNFLAKTNK